MSPAERFLPRDARPAGGDRVPRVHPAAFVDRDARLGVGVEIGPGAVIERDALLGNGARVLAHAVVCAGTIVGPHVEIHMGAIVGHTPQIRGRVGPCGHVEIGARTIVREHATIHRASRPGAVTRVGEACFIMAGAHVAHDCQLAEGVTLANGALLAGHVSVGAQAFISGNVVVHQFVRVGELSLIGGQAAVGKDVPPFVIIAGRSRVRGLNVVGLRRAGYTAEQRRRIRLAYGIFYLAGHRLDAAVAAIRALGDHREVRTWLDFLAESSRGYCRPRPSLQRRSRPVRLRTA